MEIGVGLTILRLVAAAAAAAALDEAFVKFHKEALDRQLVGTSFRVALVALKASTVAAVVEIHSSYADYSDTFLCYLFVFKLVDYFIFNGC